MQSILKRWPGFEQLQRSLKTISIISAVDCFFLASSRNASRVEVYCVTTLKTAARETRLNVRVSLLAPAFL